jgi:hypothetical protein
MLMGTLSWGGGEDETNHSNMGLSHDFSNLLNLSGGDAYGGQPALRGRAATEPWGGFGGGNDPLLVSRIDPEHNAGDQRKTPPRVSSLVDTNKFSSAFDGQQGRKPDGC